MTSFGDAREQTHGYTCNSLKWTHGILQVFDDETIGKLDADRHSHNSSGNVQLRSAGVNLFLFKQRMVFAGRASQIGKELSLLSCQEQETCRVMPLTVIRLGPRKDPSDAEGL